MSIDRMRREAVKTLEDLNYKFSLEHGWSAPIKTGSSTNSLDCFQFNQVASPQLKGIVDPAGSPYPTGSIGLRMRSSIRSYPTMNKNRN